MWKGYGICELSLVYLVCIYNITDYIYMLNIYTYVGLIQHTVQTIITLLTCNIWTKCSLAGC